MIERNIALEARLIDDLLDLTRITRGKLSLLAEPCDAHSLIGMAIEIVRDEAREKQVDLRLALAARRTQLTGDPARLQQALWNLLRNAVKFTPHGGCVSVSSCDHAERDVICIQVRDNGIGFESHEAERLFEPFQQVVTGRGGLGLGLAIAQAVVTLHRGSICGESDGPGCGATFTIELPAALPSATDSVLSPSSRHARRDGLFQPEPAMRLLIVEDHPETLRVVSRLLAKAGHAVTSARSLAEARAAAGAAAFDAVISDLGLPDGTGNELMSSLRDQYGLQGIALSGYGMDEDVRRSREAGFVSHLVKPVDIHELRHALRRLATRKRG
jgi:CheY-like chemotaxis protein/anti-sigma regulatory factor (Ser/Thr protein kinase)